MLVEVLYTLTVSIVASVVAGIVLYYICKWLDRR